MPEVIYTFDRDSRVAALVIDTPGKVNTIGLGFTTDLEKAVALANKDRVAGVIIASGKGKSFLDGANLQEVMSQSTPQLVRVFIQRFQDACAALAGSPFPVVGVLDGQTALGGGFELLLWACDHVFVAPGSRMGLPEVNVGLFPAAGGTQTLRKIVGFKTAVEMITGARVSPAEAFTNTGFVTMCASGELKSRAVSWIGDHQGILNRNYDPDYQEPGDLSAEERQEIINRARSKYTISPFRPYFSAAIDSMEAGLTLSFKEAVRNDVDLVVPLLEDPNVHNKFDLFFLTTSLGPRLVRVDSRNAAKVENLAVIGAGLMGRGIAQVAADAGIKVTLIDLDEESTRASVDAMERTLEDLVSRGRWPRDRKDALMSNLAWTTDYSDLREAPLVLECVFEDLALKKEVLARVQDVNAEAIFASNTSTIPIAEIAHGASRPEQVVGMHYFSPVPLMPLLEVIEGPQSSPGAVATAVTAGRAMGKTVILVGDGPGFYTSRTFGTYVMNGFRLAELGVSPWDADLMALQLGFRQGPLHVYGTAGGAVVYHASSFVADRFPDRVKVPESLKKCYEAGYVGAGKPSFYKDLRKMIPDESILEHIVRAEGLPTPSKEEAMDILILGMVNEAFWSLSDGVLRDYYAMDLGAALGIGFPDCRHGPARYVSERGVKAVKARLEDLVEKFQIPGLDPAPEFDQLIACGLDSHLI